MSYVHLAPQPTPKFALCYDRYCITAENGPAWLLARAAVVLGAVWVISRL